MIKDLEIEKQIKEYFLKFKQIQKPCVEIFLKNNDNAKMYLENILNEIPEWLSCQNIINGIVKDFDLPICKTCGRHIKYFRTFTNKNIDMPIYCSIKCSANDPDYKKQKYESYKKTMMEKYGVVSYAQTPEFKEKFKETSLRHYGVENPSSSLEVKEKRLKTCNEKIWW